MEVISNPCELFTQGRLKEEEERLAREEARLPAPKWEWQIYQIRARGIRSLLSMQWQAMAEMGNIG